MLKFLEDFNSDIFVYTHWWLFTYVSSRTLFYLQSDGSNLVINKLTEWFILFNAKIILLNSVHIERKRNRQRTISLILEKFLLYTYSLRPDFTRCEQTLTCTCFFNSRKLVDIRSLGSLILIVTLLEARSRTRNHGRHSPASPSTFGRPTAEGSRRTWHRCPGDIPR